jgi:hypothetical protein
MDPFVHHLDPKVEPTDEPADRPSHPDSHARPPAPSPANACLPCGPRLPRVRPWSHSRPAPAVSPHIPVLRRTPSTARTFRACACGSAIFSKFRRALNHFCYNASVIFRFLVHSLSVTQSYFRFRQPFLRFHHALSHICYNGSAIFWISSANF